MTAAAYCASNNIFYQLQLVTAKSQLTPIIRISALSSPSSSSIISISHSEEHPKTTPSNQNDENNNQAPLRIKARPPDPVTSNDGNINRFLNDYDEEAFLSGVGLRRKRKKSPLLSRTLRPLAKRLTGPICLLPLPKNSERVRQALYVVLPYLKFLSIIRDVENFCSTDSRAEVEGFSSRSATQMRNTTTVTSKTIKHSKLSKSEFIALATDTLRNRTTEASMSKYVDNAIHCYVALDRLDEYTIDQMMKDSIEDNHGNITTVSARKRPIRDSSEKSRCPLPLSENSSKRTTTKTTTTRTTITTLTTEKTTIKQKSATTPFNQAKRLKRSGDDNSITFDRDPPGLTYRRIYLKCFVCSKREYINDHVTNSDTLHSHWLQHGNDLSLNIYDSEIDSILTRVVEFFHFPKRHNLEGKIQTVYILNSEEVRKSRSITSSDDTCIVLD